MEEVPGGVSGSRRNEDIALDLMKFVAMTTGYGRTTSSGVGFQGTGAAFSVAGIPIARDAALVEGGFDWRFAPQAKLGAFYQGELAAHAQTHAVKGAFTWDF